MKQNGHGKAKILSASEIAQLLEALPTVRDRAVAAIGLFTGCRISEICSLRTADTYIYDGQGWCLLPVLTVRKGSTKGQVATRQIPVHPQLAQLLAQHQPGTVYVFPSRWHPWRHLNPRSYDRILRHALAQANIAGASTHSFRRTCLSTLSAAGVPLRVIQEISGHRSLDVLQGYLEVQPHHLHQAIRQLDFPAS
jgi:integrase/recombinase XerD